ncbi:hypothetical protein ANCDUO_14461 [Ancylostoma duodenale]|uniref:Uncharacterized protein n=1 Tax=Ancylostoma duodenale TaxID=51022 RepID=A0A0C2D039_9BILA|nr:hypothetical protein ANCDUO_14461 [Ancylostoma duodenale]
MPHTDYVISDDDIQGITVGTRNLTKLSGPEKTLIHCRLSPLKSICLPTPTSHPIDYGNAMKKKIEVVLMKKVRSDALKSRDHSGSH